MNLANIDLIDQWLYVRADNNYSVYDERKLKQEILSKHKDINPLILMGLASEYSKINILQLFNSFFGRQWTQSQNNISSKELEEFNSSLKTKLDLFGDIISTKKPITDGKIAKAFVRIYGSPAEVIQPYLERYAFILKAKKAEKPNVIVITDSKKMEHEMKKTFYESHNQEISDLETQLDLHKIYLNKVTDKILHSLYEPGTRVKIHFCG